MKLTAISFNCMGLFSFDTFRGFLQSINVLQRINKIGEILEKENADIILLQEVHMYFVLNLLKTKLKSYPHVAYKNYIYGPRGGLVIFSKMPIEHIEYVNYKKRGSIFNKSFVTQVIRNGILTCKIKNKPLLIATTYLTPNMDYDHSPNNRYSKYSEAQLRQLINVIQDFVKKGNQVIVGGDFNIDKKSYLYKLFLSLSKAKDPFKQYNIPTKHQEYYPEDQKVERLDYIFYIGKSRLTVVSSTHLFTKKVKINKEKSAFLSDHLGLKTTMKL